MSTTGKKNKYTNIWRLNNMLLNNQQITEEIKICIQMNGNENTTTLHLRQVEKEDMKNPIVSRRKEIIKKKKNRHK